MSRAGLAVELLETRHVRAAFKTMPVKTDKKDARGITQLMQLGWFRPVHCKSVPAQEVRAVLTARKLLQCKLHDVEMSLRGILRGFGLKVGATTPGSAPLPRRQLPPSKGHSRSDPEVDHPGRADQLRRRQAVQDAEAAHHRQRHDHSRSTEIATACRGITPRPLPATRHSVLRWPTVSGLGQQRRKAAPKAAEPAETVSEKPKKGPGRPRKAKAAAEA